MSECPEPTCEVDVILTAHQNPRNGRWTILPLHRVADDEPGDFHLTTSYHETVNIMGESAGEYPISLHVPGMFRTHHPSHFLGEVH